MPIGGANAQQAVTFSRCCSTLSRLFMQHLEGFKRDLYITLTKIPVRQELEAELPPGQAGAGLLDTMLFQ